jgi:hypothetical protein
LKSRLTVSNSGEVGPLYLTTAAGDAAAHTNASVMLGAYLVLCEEWSVEAIIDCLGIHEAARKFPCSWGKPDSKENTWIMTVKCCWEGLHMAWRHGWIDAQCLNDAAASRQYRDILAIYDAAWIVPSEILVTADPVTTAEDPNPETFSEVWSPSPSPHESPPVPPELPHDHDNATSLLKGFIKTTRAKGDIAEISDETESTDCSECASVGSVETVCKDFTPAPSAVSLFLKNTVAFANFAQDCGVTFVIRTNFSNEPGMPRPSYNAKNWSQLGIRHANIRYVDKNGGLPDAASIASLLLADQCMRNENPGAILIHCKGGFGRSVVLACCLAIYRHDVPGSALLGWARIARPGAVTNVHQEKFLMSLQGRSDVISLAAKSGNQSQELRQLLDGAAGARKKSPSCCTMQ